MWGIFFEDINFGADGGLYAEMVKNRGFEFPDPFMGWITVSPSLAKGQVTIRDDAPFDPANAHYARIESEGTALFGLSNEGFRGMGAHKGEDYDLSARIRGVEGSPTVIVQLVGEDGTTLSSTRLTGFSHEWQKVTATLQPNDTDSKARLAVLVEGRGTLDLDMVSLFPRNTWKSRPGGLRADMVQALADLKPGFMRFPGGCIVEGSVLSRRYQWKNTIGPVEDRKLNINRWNYEFVHRPTPDYFQSYGLGFFEFFQLCEDIGATPLPILNCGMACQFNSGELVPLNELDPYIQDALDLIDFANAPVTSEWGAKRAALGHPEPFHMKLLGVGNEQWGPQYLERYTRFAKVLKEKHPEISLVSDAGPSPADDRFQFLWPKLEEMKADIVDQHCYANPIWFLANTHRYDSYDRSGPKVFMGEYAAQSVAIVSTKNRNNLDCALAEAAYMTGLERNADVVRMASYAPLFANTEAWQWTPNLIWVDSLRTCPTPNYYVQQLFMHNRGDVVLPVDLAGVDVPAVPSGGIGLGTYQTAAEFQDVRVTRNGETLMSSDFPGGAGTWTPRGGKWGTAGGAYQQSDANANGTATVAGDPSWTDYTLSLKARKTEGKEGFLILVRSQDPENYVVWNLGGFGNHFHTLQSRLGQQDQQISQVPGSIEPGKWYDIRVELKGATVNCYLDGKLVQSGEVPPVRVQRLYASAARDNAAGEIILKVVNPGDAPIQAEVNLQDAAGVDGDAQSIVLTSDSPQDMDTFDRPDRVAPRTASFQPGGSDFQRTFPRYSMTVLRVKTRQ